jgi:hypothetical protein
VNDNKQTLTLDGQVYALADLPQVARDTLVSLQFVEARLQQLRGEMAVSQTAHVAYARALKAELAQTSGTVSSTTQSP